MNYDKSQCLFIHFFSTILEYVIEMQLPTSEDCAIKWPFNNNNNLSYNSD